MKNPKKSGSLSLLGRSTKFPQYPIASTLETFKNENVKRDYWIIFDCQEFTSLCPVTGQPDFAKIRIEYIPDRLCIETKSLKFYLSGFRNVRAFNETIANQILDDILKASHPRRVIVQAEFSSRGGISLSVNAEYPNRRSKKFDSSGRGLIDRKSVKP